MQIDEVHYDRTIAYGTLQTRDRDITRGMYDVKLIKKLLKMARDDPEFKDVCYIGFSEIEYDTKESTDTSEVLYISNGYKTYILMPHETD